MRLFRSYSVVLLIALFVWFGMPSGQAQAFSLSEFSKSISAGLASGIDGLTESTAKINNAFSALHANIRNSVAVSQEKIGSTIDTQLVASANVFDSLRDTLYCSITSVLRLDRCNEATVTQDSTSGEPSGGTATFIVGQAPAVSVERSPATPTLIVQSSLPRYIAPVELSGLTEAQVEMLIARRISAINPIVNNYYETVGSVGSIGSIQGPSEITTIVERLDDIESVTNNISTSQWTTIGSHIYYSTGNVGIGTTTPDFDLTVAGDVGITGTLNFNGNAGTAGYILQSQGNSTAPQWVATSSLGITSQWTTLNSNIYYSAGNVGVGTTTPSHALTVSGDTNLVGALRINGSSGTTGSVLMSNGSSAPTWTATSSLGLPLPWAYTSSGSDIYFGSGNVAIGTTSATLGLLNVNGSIRLLPNPGTISGITASNGDGTDVSLSGGTSGGAGVLGGTVTARGGVVGTGGGVELTGRSSTIGGAISITAGNNSGSGHGGSTAIFSGGNSSNGGNISMSGGSSAGATGGGVFINGGTGSATGHVSLQGASTGNVGIGSSTPLSARLTVVGAPGTLLPFLVASSSSAGTPLFAVNHVGAVSVNNSYGTAGSVLMSNGSGSGAAWTATSSLGISGSRWSASGSNIYYNSGNVGIGTGDPTGLFSLHTTANSGTIFSIASSTASNTGTSTIFSVFPSGQVAIGTTTVYSMDKLTVLGDIRLTDYNPNRDEVYIRAGTTTSGNGLNLRLRGGEVVSQTAAEISLQGANSNSGGNININGGSGSVDNGGSISISAGGGNSGNGGANVTFSGGNSGGGGEINLNSGNTSSGGTRGASIRLNGGSGPCCSSSANRGFVLLQEFSHGQVGIGTSTPGATLSLKASDLLEPLLISSTTESTIYFILRRNGAVGIGTGSPSRKLHVVTTADEPPVRFEDSSGYCEINPTTTTWSCVSDQRLKKDIVDLDSVTMLEKLSRIRAVNFRWNNQQDEDLRFGMIAQDVEQYFPEFVQMDEKGYKSVSYGSFTSVIVSAVQELNTRLTRVEEALALAEMQSLNGPLHTMILDTITATLGVFNKVQIEDGVELKDKATGQTYCLTIVMGEWAKTQGECGTNVNTNTGNNTGSGDSDESNDTGTTTDGVVTDDEENGTSTEPVVIDDEPEAEVNEPEADEPEPTIEVSEPTELPEAVVETELTPSDE